jgi:hypothetical protein
MPGSFIVLYAFVDSGRRSSSPALLQKMEDHHFLKKGAFLNLMAPGVITPLQKPMGFRFLERGRGEDLTSENPG